MSAIASIHDYSLESELERKAFETLEMIVRHHQQGKLSESQAIASINTLFSAVGGLVSEDVMRMMVMFRDRLPDDCVSDTRILERDDGSVVIVRRMMKAPVVDSYSFRFSAKRNAVTKRFDDEVAPDASAKEYIKKAVLHFKAAGFKEV